MRPIPVPSLAGAAATLSLLAQLMLLSRFTWPWLLLAVVAAGVALVASWRRGGEGRLRRGLRRVLALLLVVNAGLALWLGLAHRAGEEHWEERARAHLEAGAGEAVADVLALEAAARRRAQEALAAADDLAGLDRPLSLGTAPLPVGVSTWRDGRLVAWAGELPGPTRPEPSDDPLIVDHGFRRFLSVSAAGEGGEVAWVDVGLGFTRELFARLSQEDATGDPLERATGLEVELLAEPPVPGDEPGDPATARIVPVPAESPWIWLRLAAPPPRAERQLELSRRSRALAWGVLAALLVGAVAAWRRWPGRDMGRREALATLGMAGLLLLFRWLVSHAGLLELAFVDPRGTAPLLLEPSYFATGRLFGLARSALGLLLSATVLAVVLLALLPAWLRLLGRLATPHRGAMAAGLLVATSAASLGAAHGLHALATRNANPRLVGLDAPFFTGSFLLLQLALFLLALGPLAWLLPGWARLARAPRGAWWALAGAGVLLGLELLRGAPPVVWVWSATLPLLGAALAPSLREPAFARRVFAGLLGLLWLAGLQGQGLLEEYRQLKEEVAAQEATQRQQPRRNWREFFLQDVLAELAADRPLMAELADPTRDRTNAAFELWAGTNLGKVGQGTRVLVLGRDGERLSEFALGVPREPPLPPGIRLDPTPPLRMWNTELIEERTADGEPGLVFRGLLDVARIVPGGDVSAVVLEMRFAGGSSSMLEADRLGAAALGLPVPRELAPRREFEEPVRFGAIGPGGAPADPRLQELVREGLPDPGQWEGRRVDGRHWRVRLYPGGAGQPGLLVAFAEPSLADRLLDLSRLAALYIVASALGLVLLLLLRRLRPGTEAGWPSLLGQFGFQEKLLGAIALVVLLPVFVMGVFHERRGDERLQRENLEEVERRLSTALELLGSGVDEIATALIGGEYVQEILSRGTTTALRALGPFDRSQLVVFDPDGRLLLDETLRDLDDDEAAALRTRLEGRQLRLESDLGGWYVGRSYSWADSSGRAAMIYMRRQLDDGELARLASTVGADLTLYDGPWAVLSSQDFLFRSGLRTPVLPAPVARRLLEGSTARQVRADPAGGLVIATGYARLPGLDGAPQGVLSARLFAQATESAREQRRAQLFLLGLSSLAFVLAVVAGLLLASRIVDPLRQLVAATRRVGAGELEIRLPAGGGDELGLLMRSFNDMTARLRNSQRRLAARRSFLEAMLGNLSAGVLVLDGEGELVEWNQAGRTMLEAGGQLLLRRLRALGPPEGVVQEELQVAGPEGPRTFRWVGSPARLESGGAGWLVVVDDVTELLESRRLQLYAHMARQVAHEVKNPLTPIQLAAQMVRQACQDDHPQLGEIVDEQVRQIEGQVERLRGIASEFSLLGRDDPLALTALDLGSMLEELRALYPSPGGQHALVVELQGSPVVRAEREALWKVLTNLVENGLQAMGGKGRLQLVAGPSAPGRVELRVLDEGPGIAPELLDRLFEPYFSTKSTGTGLGLVICRNLVEKMGGRIRLQNRPGGTGAAAVVELPAAEGPTGTDPAGIA